jgi:hypothetical protein
VGMWIAEMKLAPETREVSITYRVPEPIVMKRMVAGALCDAIHHMLAPRLTRMFRVAASRVMGNATGRPAIPGSRRPC